MKNLRALALMLLIVSTLQVPAAQAACSAAPNKPLLNFTVQSDGIEFTVTPSAAGCPATSLIYSYNYYDQSTKSWGTWTNWVTGSYVADPFSIKVKSVEGKILVAFAVYAKNIWGESEQSRENEGKNGISFDLNGSAADKAALELKAREDAELAAEEKEAAEELAAWNAKKLTITCTKGKATKKVTGDPPACPSGYTNSKSGYLTFQAFSKCRLYKQDSPVGGAELLDAGKTLDLHLATNTEFLLSALKNSDFNCATKILKMPAFVGSKISSTRALDGIQSAKWGKISAFWNYHPDDGLKITFTTK